MNTLDLLIVGVNALLILVIYQIVIKFWDYRIKQRLIKEGFIDELNLKQIFHWNKKKERFNLVRTGLFTMCTALGLLIIYFTGISNYEGILMISTMMISLALGAFLSLIFIKKN